MTSISMKYYYIVVLSRVVPPSIKTVYCVLCAGKSEYPVSGIPFVLFSLPVSDPKYFHINRV